MPWNQAEFQIQTWQPALLLMTITMGYHAPDSLLCVHHSWINPWALMHSSTMLTECGIFVSIRQGSYRVFLRAQVQIKHASQAFLFLGPLRPLLTELHCSSCSTLTTPLLWAPPLYSSLAKHTEQEQKFKIPSTHCRLCFAVQRTDVLCPLCWHSSSHPSPTLHCWLSRTMCSPFMGPG